MDNDCAIKTGFFVLRTCPNMPQFTCSNCNRSICQHHTRNEGSDPVCLECNAKLNPGKNEKDEADWDKKDFLSDMWYFSVRENYYRSNEHFGAFSDDDYDGFERSHQSDFMDDRDTGSLFDS